MKAPPPDDDAGSLAALEACPLDPFLAARVHTRARAAFARGERPASRLLGVVTAAATLAVVAEYLTWTALFLGALAGG